MEDIFSYTVRGISASAGFRLVDEGYYIPDLGAEVLVVCKGFVDEDDEESSG